MEPTLITGQARRWAAEPFEPATFEVGRNDIVRYAFAVGADDGVHTDVEAARAAGCRDLLAPPCFPYVIRMHAAHLGGRDRLPPPRPGPPERAPPCSPSVIRMPAAHRGGRDRLEPDGSATEDVPPLEVRRAMAGETEIEWGVPVFAGDTITLHKEIVDVYEKVGRSGPMAFVKTQFTFWNQHDEMVMRERFTRIYR